MSKKSRKELEKAEAILAKAKKIEAKAKKIREEAALVQLHSMRKEVEEYNRAANLHIEASGPAAPEAAGDQDLPASLHLRKRWPIYLALGTAAILACGIYFASRGRERQQEEAPEQTAQPAKTAVAAPLKKSPVPESVTIEDVWEMPEELHEISGNVFIDSVRIACVEDNDGVIYMYNLATRKVESRLRFTGKGDFEGLTRVGPSYYVLRSDGRLFEVTPDRSGPPRVTEHELPLGTENDNESLFYDAARNRLLVGVKERDPSGSDYKGVYAFDLGTKEMSLEPVMRIARASEDGQKTKAVKPSEMAIAADGTVYVLNGPHAELLIAAADGAVLQTIKLDKSVLPQPEGLSFGPDGSLYISSEGGKKGTGAIAKVQLR